MRTVFLLTLLSLPLAGTTVADNWPQWRGPNFNGSSAETKLPAEFSKTEKVKWATTLSGPSAATPIVWEEHVFVSSSDPAKKMMRALGLDRKTGRVLWNEEVGVGYGFDDRSNFASPSPVTDGKKVIFYYGDGDLAAFDFSGKKIWARNLGKDYGTFAFNWTYGSSPLLFDGKLFVEVIQRDVPVHGHGRADGVIESYLLAIEPDTGKTLWKQSRASKAHQESREAYSTPIPFAHDGRTELVIVGGDCITGHRVMDGTELWRWDTWNPTRIEHWRLVPSPVSGGGVVLACAPKGSPIYAFKAGGKGDLDDGWIKWKSQEREVSSDVATPLFYKGFFYVLNGDRRTISRVNPATGKAEWTGDLESRIVIQSSPTAGDDKIYFQNFHGEVFVVAAGNSFKLLHKASMGDDDDDMVRSCIAIAHGELFVRTGHKLYCVGE